MSGDLFIVADDRGGIGRAKTDDKYVYLMQVCIRMNEGNKSYYNLVPAAST